MENDRVDDFPFDFEPNELPFGSKSKGKLSPRSHPNGNLFLRVWQNCSGFAAAKSFPNFVKFNQIWIVITLFQSI